MDLLKELFDCFGRWKRHSDQARVEKRRSLVSISTIISQSEVFVEGCRGSVKKRKNINL